MFCWIIEIVIISIFHPRFTTPDSPLTWSYRVCLADYHRWSWFSHAGRCHRDRVSRPNWVFRFYSLMMHAEINENRKITHGHITRSFEPEDVCVLFIWNLIRLLTFRSTKETQSHNSHILQRPDRALSFPSYSWGHCHTWRKSFRTHLISACPQSHRFVDSSPSGQRL